MMIGNPVNVESYSKKNNSQFRAHSQQTSNSRQVAAQSTFKSANYNQENRGDTRNAMINF